MKKFIYIILFSIFLMGCATTNNISPKINKDNKRLEAAFRKYAGYNELVSRGFDIHSLDYITNRDEFFSAIDPYFYSYEDGTGFDGHFRGHHTYVSFANGEYIYDQNTKDLLYKSCITEDSFGTKDELLAKGYIPNKTMFYYPSHGKKDWIIGELGEQFVQTFTSFPINKNNSKTYYFFEDDNYIFIKIANHLNISDNYKDFLSKAKKKDIVIVDLTHDDGGYRESAVNLANGLLLLKDKKIYILIGSGTGSCGEILTGYLKKHNPEIKLVGINTAGAVRYSSGLQQQHDYPELGFSIGFPEEKPPFYFDIEWVGVEGIGIFPDYWAATLDDIISTINWDLGYINETSLFVSHQLLSVHKLMKLCNKYGNCF